MPRSSSGNVMPQSTTTMPSDCSRARQFIPISPRPPTGTMRTVSPAGGSDIGPWSRGSIFRLELDWVMAVRRVSVLEAKKLVDEGYCYLDVRTVEEFAA